MWSISCDVNADAYSCESSNSGYNNSLRSDTDNILQIEQFDSYFVRRREIRLYGSMIFKVPVNTDQVVKSAECNFKVESTYGCTGCTEPAFVVISAANIESTGLVPFKSNCSFFLKEVACSATPQRVPIVGTPETCEIKIKGQNQSLIFSVDYKFRGQVFTMGVSTFTAEASVSERLSMTLGNPNFITSLQISMGLGASIALLSTVIRSVSRYSAYKMAKQEVNSA